MPAKSSTDRYGTVAVAIHWTSAAMIVLLLATGLLAANQTDDAASVALLRAHVPFGIAALALTLFRILWWIAADRAPLPPASQPAWQRTTARIVHLGLYVVILLTAVSGVGTLVLSGALPAIIAGAALPDFSALVPRLVHGLAARLMLVLLALHVGAALYHQFIRRDRLLARMGIGAGRA